MIRKILGVICLLPAAAAIVFILYNAVPDVYGFIIAHGSAESLKTMAQAFLLLIGVVVIYVLAVSGIFLIRGK